MRYSNNQIKLPDTEINTWTVDVNTYISEVVEYEQGKPCIELGDYDNRGPIKTTINISYNN